MRMLCCGVLAILVTTAGQSDVQATNDRPVREWQKRLQRMENLKSPADRRAINCGTCHRGSVDPHEPQP